MTQNNKEDAALMPKPSRLTLRSIAPNIVTVLALCAGLTSIKFALAGKFELSVAAIILAGVLDGVDGSIARMLKSTSKFGAELDSLSDAISFGVAPAIITYMWALQSLKGLGWVVALIYAVSCALRLARFNTGLDENGSARKKGYLTGVPAPLGAGLALVPMITSFEFGVTFMTSAPFVAVWLAIVSLGLVSTLPTYSAKQLLIPRDKMMPLLVIVALVAALITTYGWLTALLVGIIYVGSIPFSVMSYKRSLLDKSE